MKSVVSYDKTSKELSCENSNLIPNVCKSYFNTKKCKEYYKSIEAEEGFFECPYGFSSYCSKGKILTCLLLKGKKLNKTKENLEKYNQKLSNFMLFDDDTLKNFISDIETVDMENIKMRDCIHDLRNMGAQFNSMVDEFERENPDIYDVSESAISLTQMYQLINYRLDLLNEQESYIGTKKAKKLHKIISKLILLLKYQARKKEISFELSNKQNYYTMSNNYTYLGFYVLLENSVKHALPNSKVTIDFQEDDNHTVVIIKNKGQKIENEEIHLLGTRGYRGKNTISKGTGLGLEIAKKIFRDNDCKFDIKVSDCDNGEHSEFSVIIEFENCNND